MDGVVTDCAGGAIEEIHWRNKDLDGTLPVALGDLNMPKLRVLDLFDNTRLKGAVDKLLLPEGMQTVDFWCTGLTGNIGQLNLPVGMQTVNFEDCDSLTGKFSASERAKVKNYYGP
jgi:hypothetical protein